MPPRPPIPIPRLTLFTGGKECSLCEVAKQELAILRRSVPFELTSFNIQSPPPETDEKEAKRWRRLYQYDIPVLHLEDRQIQKHRIDSEALRRAIEAWQAVSRRTDTAHDSPAETTLDSANRASTSPPPFPSPLLDRNLADLMSSTHMAALADHPTVPPWAK